MLSNWNQILEDAIMGRLVTTMIDAGFRVQLCDQDGGGLFLYAKDADEPEGVPEDGYKMWVRLVPGNGADLIVDYTTNLEDTLKLVNGFARKWQD